MWPPARSHKVARQIQLLELKSPGTFLPEAIALAEDIHLVDQSHSEELQEIENSWSKNPGLRTKSVRKLLEWLETEDKGRAKFHREAFETAKARKDEAVKKEKEATKRDGGPTPDQAPNRNEDALNPQPDTVEHDIAPGKQTRQSATYDDQPQSTGQQQSEKENSNTTTQIQKTGVTLERPSDLGAKEPLTPESEDSIAEIRGEFAAQANGQTNELKIDPEPVSNTDPSAESEQPSPPRANRGESEDLKPSTKDKFNGGSEMSLQPLYKVSGGRYIYLHGEYEPGFRTASLIPTKKHKTSPKNLTTLKSGTSEIFKKVKRDDFEIDTVALYINKKIQKKGSSTSTCVARMRPKTSKDRDILRKASSEDSKLLGMIDEHDYLVFSKSVLGPGMKPRLRKKLEEQGQEVPKSF